MQDKGLTAKREGICAVVVTFNRKALLYECLTALSSQTKHLDEIIVIDNASSDGTDELIGAEFNKTTYIKLPENIGGAGGFHEGLKLAYEKGHDWIWVMDDDAIPMHDALEKLLDCPVRRNDEVYALASAVLNRDGSIFLAHRRIFDAKELTETMVDASKYDQDYFQMDTASFVGFAVSRRAIEAIGLPLKEMFIYFDDTEYSLRIRKKGIMVTVPASKIVHGVPTKSLKNSVWGQPPSGWKKYYAIRNSIYAYKKHGEPGFTFYMRQFRETLYGAKETLGSGKARYYNLKIILSATFDGLRGKLGKNSHFLPG